MTYYMATWNHELTDGHWCADHAPIPGENGNPPQCEAPGYAGPCEHYWDCIDVFSAENGTDFPIHCAADGCDELLSDELTEDGKDYVREHLATDRGQTPILELWAETWPELTVPSTPAIPDNAATESAGELDLAIVYKGRDSEGRCEYRWWATDTATNRVWSEQDLSSGVGDAPDAEAMLGTLASFLAADAETYGRYGTDQIEYSDGYAFPIELVECAHRDSDELPLVGANLCDCGTQLPTGESECDECRAYGKPEDDEL